MLFENNKYSRWYNSIIQSARERTTVLSYSEKHHIIPKSIGGSNLKENLVSLTAREHFICHYLLTKMLTGSAKQKMIYAFWQLANVKNLSQDRYRATNKSYEVAKKLFAAAHSSNMKQNHPLRKEENKRKHQLGVDKRGPTSVKGAKRSESMKEKMRNRTWTEKAIQNRLKNCLDNAAKRKGKPNPEHGNRIFNAYVNKNKDLFPQIWSLYNAGINRRQISMQLGISWDRVDLAINRKLDIQSVLENQNY